MNVWVVYTYVDDYEGGPGEPEAVFADPGDAMIWSDEEFDLTATWQTTLETFFCRWDKFRKVCVESVEFFPFVCQSFVYAGPGHQSRHQCDCSWPHPLDGEHFNDMHSWNGTAVEEDAGPLMFGGVEQFGRRRKRLVKNADYY